MAEPDYRFVTSRADLVEFIRRLNSALRNNLDEFENSTLESFLEGAGAWLDDIDSETNFQRTGAVGAGVGAIVGVRGENRTRRTDPVRAP